LIQKAMEECRVDADIAYVEDGQVLLQRLACAEDEQARPSLVLLDLNMPRMDGREVLRIVKHDPVLKDIPIVVLTNSNIMNDIAGAYHEGANTFFRKPMDYTGLLELLELMASYWPHTANLPGHDS